MKESNRIMKQLAELLKDPGITCMSKEQINNILTDFHMKNKLLDFVYVLNDKGKVIASSNSSGIGADFSFRPWFIEVLNGKKSYNKNLYFTHNPYTLHYSCCAGIWRKQKHFRYLTCKSKNYGHIILCLLS
jgi:C4-dicarboxylate-specific signal transduction histidine kinase